MTKATKSLDDKPICDDCLNARLRNCGQCNKFARITGEKSCRECQVNDQQNLIRTQLKKCPTCNREKRRRKEPECDDCSLKRN
jgi:hypothetical protein